MKFWDTSALVPFLVAEPATTAVQTAYRQDPVVLVAWTTAVECASAVARAEREGWLNPTATSVAFTRLDEILHTCHEIEPSAEVRDVARRLLRVHTLRAADAIQLASALLAAQHRPATLPFVTLDARLASTAAKEGFPVVQPGVA